MSAHSKCAAEAQQQADAVYVERKPVPSIVSSVVNLSYRQEKFRIRRDLLTLIKEDLPAAISALTLPGSEWLMERDILWSVPDSSIVGLEAIKDMFEYAKANVPTTERVAYLHMDDKTYFSQKRGVSFNFIWLDYMGQFSPSRLAVYETMLANGFVENNSIVALTFLKGREIADTLALYKKFGKPKKNIIKGRFNILVQEVRFRQACLQGGG